MALPNNICYQLSTIIYFLEQQILVANNFWFEAKNICCFKNEYEVVKDLNLKLRYYENVILIGPNGAGKSSLIELINRNIYPVLNKNTVFKIFDKELINIWELRKKISTVNHDIRKRISPKLKVFDLIISGLYGVYCKIPQKSEEDCILVENQIQKMNLSNISQKYYSQLSEGEKQIALIARALIKKPEILILDEPITNLDLKSKFYVIDQINELSKINTSIICITHDITLITRIYNRIIMMKDRRIISDGKQSQVINKQNINNLFDINVDIIGYEGNWNVHREIK